MPFFTNYYRSCLTGIPVGMSYLVHSTCSGMGGNQGMGGMQSMGGMSGMGNNMNPRTGMMNMMQNMMGKPIGLPNQLNTHTVSLVYLIK